MARPQPRREEPDSAQIATQVRALVRRAATATLSTLLARDGSGHPYGSLVVAACDPGARPLLLLSDLADHSRNLAADPRASLLYDGTAGLADPLTGARVSLLGRIERSARKEDSARYLALNPGARDYAGFRDFHLYRLIVERAHLVAGFGRIHWLEAEALALPGVDLESFIAGEAAALESLNARLGDAGRARLAARASVESEAETVVLAALDPEGCDLVTGGRRRRLEFDQPQKDLASAAALVLELSRS